ncbi:BTAD domain-containing putative transcriptional regulator [Saccharothrix yanglingensis]|uniref:Transcriptional regulator n=1 Tax=Saccharothrix yanglingensis TaxID=659496 RepID=A0ABU0X4F3_9PSEU|nr:BTAD domain-containing putative transcriptional regulator [Saccharothrix yanglingensis]MDQ2586896.1 transcriptional regulator [Saccharothrix yanglingensis]
MTTPATTDAVARPRLDYLLAAARAGRITTVVAPAGYGKTTLLAGWTARAPVAWHTLTEEDRSAQPLLANLAAALRSALPALRFRPPGVLADDEDAGEAGRADRVHAMAASLCEAVAEATTGAGGREVLLVLDDLHVIGRDDRTCGLLEALCLQAPPALRVVLSSREPPPFPVRRPAGPGGPLEVSAAQLAFTEGETRQLLPDDRAAAELHRLSGGWPVAVRMAAGARVPDPAAGPVPPAAAAPHDRALYDYLAHEVFDREPRRVRELLAAAALFDRFDADLLVALGFADAAPVLDDLLARGLFVERLIPHPGWLGLIPLARAFVAGRTPPSPAERRRLGATAAAWLADRGHLAEALAALTGLADHRAVGALLAAHGEELLQRGGADTVTAAVDAIPPDERDPVTWQLAGVAHQVRGEWGPALACLRRATPRGVPTPPALAARIAAMHYFSGAPDRTLAACGECSTTGADPAAEARVRGLAASAHWARGDVAASRAEVAAATVLAEEAGDDAALAATHTVLAMVADAEGDRSAVADHYARALAHAQLAGDVLAEIRIRVNRSAHLVHEADHGEALAELETALRLADLTGFTSYRALALNNRGAAWLGLGRLDEAAADLHAARKVYTRTGSRLASLALESLGEVHRLRGERALARDAFAEAVRLAEENDAVPQLVPALAGLARVLADEQPRAAEDLVRRALSCGTGLGYPAALLAAARLALARGEPDEAAAHAGQAQAVAARRRDRAAGAAALELLGRAAAGRDEAGRDEALSLLDQAAAAWAGIGNPLGGIEVSIARARVLGGADGLALVTVAGQAAARLGARGLVAEAASVAGACGRSTGPAVSIRTLGGFRVLRRGETVPATAWQSKKARDLVKILVARRGRPATREALMALLWPDEPPERVANRFSVALSTARLVLDPDRGDGHGIVADNDQVRLDPTVVDVDVIRFLADARAGLTGGPAALLASAETAYTGDFLEEDPYADWAAELREDARLTYLQVASALAGHAAASGDHVATSRYCLRVLERDCYDETAHLALVRALTASGSHGEARRRYRTYVSRMREIDVEPSPLPDPAPLRAG